jgi:hypothetical protein
MLNKLKSYIRKITPIFYILKSFQDKRYFYHLLQGYITNPKARRIFAGIEARLFKSEKKFSNNTFLFQKQSYVENPIDIDADSLLNIQNSLKKFKCHDLENPKIEFLPNNRPSGCDLIYYNTEDMYKIKEVLEIATNKKLVSLFNHLYGCDPIIDYIGAWWSFPSSEPSHGTQRWHRDLDSLNILKFFIYLTDVDLDSGPHKLIIGSHKDKFNTSLGYHHDDNDVKSLIEKNGYKVFTGISGTNFLEDTFVVHKGETPKKNPRLILEILYSRIQSPLSPKKPFVNAKDSEFSSILIENSDLFKKIVNY